MTKPLINFIATILIAWLFYYLKMDWWSAMLAGFITAYTIPLNGFKVFLMPFSAILIFWFAFAYGLSSANDFILAKQIGVLLNVGEQPYLVMLISGFVGGLSAGISAIFGNQLYRFLKFRRSN